MTSFLLFIFEDDVNVPVFRMYVLGASGSASADLLVRVTDPMPKCHGSATLLFFPPCAGHIPAGYGERAGVPGGVTALPPPAGLPSSPAAHRTGTG